MTFSNRKIWLPALGLLLAMGLFHRAALADYDLVPNRLPLGAEGVRVDEKLGEQAPTDLAFRDHRGLATSLGKVLERGKPVLLTLNYSDCPGLCIAQLNGLLRGMNEVASLELGKDFYAVSVSIDPREGTSKAAGTHQKYSQDLFAHHDPKGWEFWTGDAQSIERLADAVGFRYTYDAKHRQYNHPTAAIFLSPGGRITRYLYELGFTGETLKMALIEAGEGLIGSSMDMIALWCVHYDPMENRYSASARQILSIAAGIFVTIGLAASLPFWLARRQRHRGWTPSSEGSRAKPPAESIGRSSPAEGSDTIQDISSST
jgi:protein SCO1/2